MKTIINFFKSLFGKKKSIEPTRSISIVYDKKTLEASHQKPTHTQQFRKQQLIGKVYLSFGSFYRIESLISKGAKKFNYEISIL